MWKNFEFEMKILNEGTHECVMEYYENGGGAVAGLYWTPPGQSESLVHGDQDENIADDAIFLTKLTDKNGKINFLWDEYQEGDMFLLTKEIIDRLKALFKLIQMMDMLLFLITLHYKTTSLILQEIMITMLIRVRL